MKITAIVIGLVLFVVAWGLGVALFATLWNDIMPLMFNLSRVDFWLAMKIEWLWMMFMLPITLAIGNLKR